MGGGRKQYQVLADPNALDEHGVTLQQLEVAIKQNNTNASGGYAIVGQRENPIRILGRLGPAPDRVIEDIGICQRSPYGGTHGAGAKLVRHMERRSNHGRVPSRNWARGALRAHRRANDCAKNTTTGRYTASMLNRVHHALMRTC